MEKKRGKFISGKPSGNRRKVKEMGKEKATDRTERAM